MKAKVLIAIALAAAIGGRAWGQAANQLWSDPYGEASTDGAGGDTMSNGFDSRTSAEAPKDPYDLEAAPNPYAPNPYAPGADPYGGDAMSNGADSGTSAEAPKDPYDLEAAPDPYAPNPYAPGANPDAVPDEATPRGAGPGGAGQQNSELDLEFSDPLTPSKRPSSNKELGRTTTHRTNPSGASKTGAELLNGDPLKILGFNPYDPQSLLGPKGRSVPSGATAAGTDPLGPGLPSTLGPPIPGGAQ